MSVPNSVTSLLMLGDAVAAMLHRRSFAGTPNNVRGVADGPDEFGGSKGSEVQVVHLLNL